MSSTTRSSRSTIRLQVSLTPFEAQQEHPSHKAFGTLDNSSGPVAVIALQYYYELLNANKLLELIQSRDLARKQKQNLQHRTDQLTGISDHQKELEELKSSHKEIWAHISALWNEVAELKKHIETERKEKQSSNAAIKEAKRLQELILVSAEIVCEVQRLIIAKLGLAYYEDADTFTSDLFQAVCSLQPTAEQKQIVTDFGDLLKQHGLPCTPYQFCQALNSFKRPRLETAVIQRMDLFVTLSHRDREKSLDQCASDMRDLCELVATQRLNEDFVQVQSAKASLLKQADMIVYLASWMLPPEGRNRPFNYSNIEHKVFWMDSHT